MRNRHRLQTEYFAMLRRHGVAHVSNSWDAMPPVGEAAGTTQRKGFKIIRTEPGGFFGLTEWEGLPMDQFQGRFVDLMSPKPLTPEVIEVAKVMLAMKGLNEQKLRGGGRKR